jgi:uncharacterized ion transporter superfamily protein YfcC
MSYNKSSRIAVGNRSYESIAIVEQATSFYGTAMGSTLITVPTSALAKVPYTAWLQFIGPLMLKILVLAAVFIVLSIHIGGAVGFY